MGSSDRESDLMEPVLATGSCPTHGDWEREVPRFLASRVTCGKCSAEVAAQRERDEAETQRKAAEARRIDHLEQIGVSERHRGRTFDTFVADTPEQAKALQACRDLAEGVAAGATRQPSLILCGKPGTGKTHLGCAIAQHLCDRKDSVLRRTPLQIIRAIKNTWQRGAEQTEADVLAGFAYQDLLIVDEVGVQFGSDTERMYLFEIIDMRYEACLPTVLISNLDIDALRTEVGERVLDRLREDGGRLLTFTGESWRKRQ